MEKKREKRTSIKSKSGKKKFLNSSERKTDLFFSKKRSFFTKS